jgi:hypothetical protein
MYHAEKQPLYRWEGLFSEPLPSNGRPIVARVRLRGNMFTESLPSNGSIRHNIIGRYIGPKQYSGYWQVPKITHKNLVGPIRCVFKGVAKRLWDVMPCSSVLRRLRNIGEIVPDWKSSHPIRTSNPTRYILVQRVSFLFFLGYQLWVLFIYEDDVTQLKVELETRSFIVFSNRTLLLSAAVIERVWNLRCCKKPQICFPDYFTWMELNLFSDSLKKVTTRVIVASLCVNKHNNASFQHTISFCLFQANSLFKRVSARAVLPPASRHGDLVSVKGGFVADEKAVGNGFHLILRFLLYRLSFHQRSNA